MKEISEQWWEYQEQTGDAVAAAILVLSQVIQQKTVINGPSAENLAHEIGLMWNNVPLSVALTGEIGTREVEQ